MRGDSVRDLYAKALALIGLAVLAGAGALMDYWPVQGSLPVVSFRYSLPKGPAALDARVALSATVVKPVDRPRPSAPVVVAAPVAAPAEVPVVIVPVDEVVAAPVAAVQASTASPEPAVMVPAADPAPIQTPAAAVELPTQASIEVMAPPKVSHTEDLAVPASTNVLQKAGGQVLNAGFALGTGVAKSFSAFGTAFSNIGKLFSK